MSMSGRNPYTSYISRVINLLNQNRDSFVTSHHFPEIHVNNETPRTTMHSMLINDNGCSQSWGHFVDPDDETKMPTTLPKLERQNARSRINTTIDSAYKSHNSTN